LKRALGHNIITSPYIPKEWYIWLPIAMPRVFHISLPRYRSKYGDGYGFWIPFISDIHQPFISLCPDAAEVRGSNPRGPTRFIDIKPNRSIDQKKIRRTYEH
jgi:hypothetical protein